jgi:hypothetical protein
MEFGRRYLRKTNIGEEEVGVDVVPGVVWRYWRVAELELLCCRSTLGSTVAALSTPNARRSCCIELPTPVGTGFGIA